MGKISCTAKLILSLIFIFHATIVRADEEADFFLKSDKQANWVFSGTLTSEQGDNYGYFFQLKKNGSKVSVNAAIIDSENIETVFIEEGDAIVGDDSLNDWRVGRAFLHFNSITDSWVFGFKSKDKRGFNFKVDMLEQLTSKPLRQALSPGLSLLVSQTSNLNGHLSLGDSTKEQFVTAKHSWFRYFSQENSSVKPHIITGSLCRFYDGAGFYSVSLAEDDAINASVAGWYDPRGNVVDMSQFVRIDKENDGLWHISFPTPDSHITLEKYVSQNEIVAGFSNSNEHKGFCMLSETTIN